MGSILDGLFYPNAEVGLTLHLYFHNDSVGLVVGEQHVHLIARLEWVFDMG